MGISKTIPWRKKGILEGSIQDTGSTGDVSFTVSGNSSEKITVNYGDGTSETKNLSNGSFSHTYPPNSGPFRITVTGALFFVDTIKQFPGFELKGIVNTPLLTELSVQNINQDGVLSGNDGAKGDISNLQFSPDLEKLSLLEAPKTRGSIDVFQKMNGRLGKGDAIVRIQNSQINGSVTNFNSISSDTTTLQFDDNNLTGSPKTFVTSSTLVNLSKINFSDNDLNGDTGSINTGVTQSSIREYNIDGNVNADLDTTLFKNAAFSSVEKIVVRGLNSYTGGDDFLTNTTSLQRLFIDVVPITADKFVNCASTLVDVVCENLQGNASVFGNNSFPNLFRLFSIGEKNQTIAGDAANFDLPALKQLTIRNAGINGTVTFTQNQQLRKVSLRDNSITDIDNDNNNYKTGSLIEFILSDNSIPQTPISDWWIYNDDANLNVPGSGDTYPMDSSGANMGTLTSAAQTAANNIAAKGWVTSFNS